MSLNDIENKEKSSVINLDSNSSFDKKSLAKSIDLSQLDEENLDQPNDKELKNQNNSEKNKNKSPNASYIKTDIIKKEDTNDIITSPISNKQKKIFIKEDEEENLLIFEKKSDVLQSILNKKIFEENLNNKNKSVEANNYYNNLIVKKMTNSANEVESDKKEIDIKKIRNNQKKETKTIDEITILRKLEILDKNLSLFIHDLHLGKNFDLIIYLFARLFNPDFIISYFIFILSYKIYSNNNFLFVLKPLASTVICLAVTLSLKKHFGRNRPEYSKKSKRIFDLRKHEKNCSMPSGDSLQAANFSLILFFYFNSIIGFFVVPFVMFARVYFYCHFISDTIVGAFLGLFSSTIVYYIINLY